MSDLKMVPDFKSNVLPSEEILDQARSSICKEIQDAPRDAKVAESMINSLLPGLNGSSQSPHYYGFVTGGATPISRFADNKVTELDQNVQVHLPKETISTDVEDAALRLLCQLVELDRRQWNHGTFTTGATASNIMGIAMGREHVIRKAGAKLENGKASCSIAKLGFLKATRLAGVEEIQVLTTVPHSSISKAASILGLGHESVKDVGFTDPSHRHRFDYVNLEQQLQKAQTASIIVVTSSEVNTGLFATQGLEDFKKLRALADKYGAWIHVDAAIGLLARVLLRRKGTSPEYRQFDQVITGAEGLELADSIAGDAHKLFNVPYDCGVFLSQHLDLAKSVFENPGAAYLAGPSSDIPSPLNVGIENSRRFRALPVYANLIRYGRDGFEEILIRQILLARAIAEYIDQHSTYELLPPLSELAKASPGGATAPGQSGAGHLTASSSEDRFGHIFIVVCFRAKDDGLNAKLAQCIKDTRQIYVSGSSWGGKPAVRFAISNWQADKNNDLKRVTQVLDQVAAL